VKMAITLQPLSLALHKENEREEPTKLRLMIRRGPESYSTKWHLI